MKILLFVSFLSITLLPAAGVARTLEVEVHGLTCAFCVDSLERAFRKIETVRDIQISLEHRKLRLEVDGAQPDDETIRRTILDAGFTPLGIIELPNVAIE